MGKILGCTTRRPGHIFYEKESTSSGAVSYIVIGICESLPYAVKCLGRACCKSSSIRLKPPTCYAQANQGMMAMLNALEAAVHTSVPLARHSVASCRGMQSVWSRNKQERVAGSFDGL